MNRTSNGPNGGLNPDKGAATPSRNSTRSSFRNAPDRRSQTTRGYPVRMSGEQHPLAGQYWPCLPLKEKQSSAVQSAGLQTFRYQKKLGLKFFVCSWVKNSSDEQYIGPVSCLIQVVWLSTSRHSSNVVGSAAPFGLCSHMLGSLICAMRVHGHLNKARNRNCHTGRTSQRTSRVSIAGGKSHRGTENATLGKLQVNCAGLISVLAHKSAKIAVFSDRS